MSDSQDQTRSSRSLTAGQVAELVHGRVEGDAEVLLHGLAPLNQATGGELGLLAQRRYLRHLPGTAAGTLLVSEDLADAAKGHPSRVVTENPHAAFPLLLAHFYPTRRPEPAVHPTAVLGRGVQLGSEVRIDAYAVIEDGAVLGDRVRVGAHSVIGEGSAIGEDSVLYPHVVLYPGTIVGARVILHSGTRLGTDGFGYVPSADGIQKVPQVGGCLIGDDVEIGANSCVDRGSIGQTVVGRFAKLDNLVHLAHNVQVGPGSLLAAMTGVAGSTEIGKGVMTGGQSGIAGHLVVGDGARLAAQAGVIKDVPPGQTVSGFPAREHRTFLKSLGLLSRLPDTLKRMAGLEERLTMLEKKGEG